MNLDNSPVMPWPWRKVGLALLPGLLVIGLRSGLIRSVFGQDIQHWLDQPGLVILCFLLIIGGWLVERHLAAWSFPALGILLFVLPITAMNLMVDFASSLPLSLSPDMISWLWLGLMGSLVIAIFVRHRHLLQMSQPGWRWLGLLVLALLLIGPAQSLVSMDEVTFPVLAMGLLFGGGMWLFPLAIGLLLARRSGLLAGLIVVAAEFWWVDGIFDASYGLLIWTSHELAERVVSLLPALCFLVVPVLWVLRANSDRGRIGGLLWPPFLGLVSGELIRSVVLQGTPREYSLGMWFWRGGSAMQFLIVVVLAVMVYIHFGRQDRVQIGHLAGP